MGRRPPEPVSAFADLEGMRVHYVSYGRRSEARVLIHVWTCDHTFWRLQAPAFTGDRRVILVDLPGHGLSDKPETSYTQDLFADAVGKVLNKAGVESAVLVGHSMGLTVARHFLRNHPGRVMALVSVDGTLLRVPKDKEKFERWRKGFRGFYRNFRGPKYEEAAGRYINFMFSKETPAELRREIKSKMLSTPRHVAIRALEGYEELAVWREDPVELPTLAVYAKTPLLRPDNERYIRRLFTDLEYHEWEGAGHFLMMERPEKFNQTLEKFLNRTGL